MYSFRKCKNITDTVGYMQYFPPCIARQPMGNLQATVCYTVSQVFTSAGFSASPLGKYHYDCVCHRHIGCNPIPALVDYRSLLQKVLAYLPQQLFNTNNVLKDFVFNFQRSKEKAYIIKDFPSLVPTKTITLYTQLQKIF